MANANAVLETMHPDNWYSPSELASVAHITEDSAKSILRAFERGGLVECIGEKYKRNKKYKTKQMRLL